MTLPSASFTDAISLPPPTSLTPWCASAPGGGRRRVAPLGGVRAGMAFKGLEDHYGRRKVHIGCVATFNGICGTFQQVSAVPSDTGAW
jgi:hypothetical protein